MRHIAGVAALLVLAAAVLVPSGFAAAAPGQLTLDRCFSNAVIDACEDAPGQPLDGAFGVAVSPDSRSVYMASSSSDAVAHFRAGGAESLAYDGCVSDDGVGPRQCQDLDSPTLHNVAGVTLSPDGRLLYAVGASSDALTSFGLGAADGRPSFAQCLASLPIMGCDPLQDGPLDGATDVAASPDGASVYVVSSGKDAVAHFRRGPGDLLAFEGCVGNVGANPPCTAIADNPLDEPQRVAVSPDGTSVYVTGGESDSVVELGRAADGRLGYRGCVGNVALGCEPLPAVVLDTPVGIALSPDGGSVYVTGGLSDTIVRFVREADGHLRLGQCVSNDDQPGCSGVPGTPFKARSGWR